MTREAACNALLARPSSYGDEAISTAKLGVYVRGHVARPLQAAPPRPLEEFLQGRAREQ